MESGLTRLRFSLDAATKETFEKIRIGADYESVMKNIERCVELRNQEGYNLPVIGVNFVKMKVNEHETEEFIEKWKDKVDFVVIQEFVPPELECDYSEFYPSDSSYQKEITNSFKIHYYIKRKILLYNGDAFL